MFWSALLISLGVFLNSVISFAQMPQKLKVVATNSIVADWVRNVAGSQVDLITLVGPDADVHTFEPTPFDDVALFKADIIFEIGLGFEHWMNKLYAASGSHAKRVVLTDRVDIDPLSIFEHGHKEDIDPHVWHNVLYVIKMVQRINRILQSSDPLHAQVYEQNTQFYLKQLQGLESWALKTVAQIPKAKRKLVTNHDSLGYFCEHYQFKLIGAAFNSATTEAEDPSAKDMADLILKIKKSGVGVVFAENMQNSKVLASLAKEAHVNLAPPLYTDALGPQGSVADTYIKMMRYNIETIVHELLKTSN